MRRPRWSPTLLGLVLLSGAVLSPTAADPAEEDLSSFAAHANDQNLLWGTYRPNLYFGMRTRSQGSESLLTGLLWFGIHDTQSYTRARHSCEQGDELAGYTWTKHDGRTAGSQIIRDPLNNVVLTTEFLKVPGGERGGSWAARIKGDSLRKDRLSRVSLIPYFGMDGLGSLEMENEEAEEGLEGTIKLTGTSPDLGSFTIRIVEGTTTRPLTKGSHAEDFGDKLDRTQYVGTPVPAGQIWRAKETIMSDVLTNVQTMVEKYGRESVPDPAITFSLSNDVRYGANFYAFQKNFEGPFEFDIFFDAGDMPGHLDTPSLTSGLSASNEAFDQRFDETFNLDTTAFTPSQVDFARAVTANLIGGIGHFQGSSIVDRAFRHDYDDDGVLEEAGNRKDADPRLTEVRSLFTATPSRSFFPRGFYWDEGFHLLLIGAWDNDLSLDILKSWINLIDEDGWVAREQILGEEARSKVPQEFQTQYPTYANPPTLTMAVTAYISRLRKRGIEVGDVDMGVGQDHPLLATVAPTSDARVLANRHLDDVALAKSFLASIYPKLRLHYDWFRRTQRGQVREWGRRATSKTEAYRWRGRTVSHVLTSGLDDYPRASPPHVGELHLDLISWMAFFSRTMKEIAEFIKEDDDKAEYEENYRAILANIEDLHWSEENQMYCDVSVDEDDESYHVCHKGYISLFPFLLGLLPPSSPHVGPILDILRDPEHLWSPYGLRSLSKSHPLFGKDEDYWRGPVWIQMNYMALQSLYNIYAKHPGPEQQRAAQIYSELRQNIIDNVYKEYERTGYAWEQYDAITGQGRRSHPFTGWTSLVTLIMAEMY